MKRQPGKPKLPRGTMPPGTRVHQDKKKERSRTACREKKWAGFCDPPAVCGSCPERGMCSHKGEAEYYGG